MINVPEILIASKAQEPYRKIGWRNEPTATETEIKWLLGTKKKRSTLLTGREMQLETTMRYHFLHIKLPKLRSWLHTLSEAKGDNHAHILLVEQKYNHDGIWENMLLPFDLAISIPRIQPKIH